MDTRCSILAFRARFWLLCRFLFSILDLNICWYRLTYSTLLAVLSVEVITLRHLFMFTLSFYHKTGLFQGFFLILCGFYDIIFMRIRASSTRSFSLKWIRTGWIFPAFSFCERYSSFSFLWCNIWCKVGCQVNLSLHAIYYHRTCWHGNDIFLTSDLLLHTIYTKNEKSKLFNGCRHISVNRSWFHSFFLCNLFTCFRLWLNIQSINSTISSHVFRL